MKIVKIKELPEIVVDEDYEGLLSSYLEPDARRKIMFYEHFDTREMNAEIRDDEAPIFPRH